MTTIRAFFLEIRALFSTFRKRAGETSPLPRPSSYAPADARSYTQEKNAYAIFKNCIIVSTYEQNSQHTITSSKLT